jgi:hypothetical protein
MSSSLGIDPGSWPPASLEHAYWVQQAARYFERRGYDVVREHAIKGDGTVDLLAERPGERVAVEIETGKSDVKENLAKLHGKRVDRVVVVATSPAAMSACQKAVEAIDPGSAPAVELMTWLDAG